MSHLHNGLHHYTQLLTAAARALGEVSGAQDFSGIERFGETLTPVIDLWALPEWALLRGEILYARELASPAVAAQLSFIELVNPAASNILVVVELVCPFGVNVRLELDSGSLGAGTTRGVPRDQRFGIGELSQCTLEIGSRAVGAALPQWILPASQQFGLPWVVEPGRTFRMWGTVVNTELEASFAWTERRLLPNESRA